MNDNIILSLLNIKLFQCLRLTVELRVKSDTYSVTLERVRKKGCLFSLKVSIIQQTKRKILYKRF